MDSQNDSYKSCALKLKLKHSNMREMVRFIITPGCIKLLGSFVLLFSGCQCSDIKGVLHKDVLLPCMVDYQDKFDYNQIVVNWQRSEDDAVVHSFFHGFSHSEYQAIQYQGRTQLFYDVLYVGNVSLLLRNLSKSDAGSYTCHTILNQSTGYITQYVYLTVTELKAEVRTANYHWILVMIPVILLILLGGIIWCIQKRKIIGRYREKKPLLELESSQENIIQKYRQHMKSFNFHDNLILQRQLLVVEGSPFCTTSGKHKGFLGEKKNIMKAENLFTPETNQLRSRRMFLVGEVGVGKSYFCKWLVNKWIKNESLIYKCILYVSCKRIKDKQISVEELVDEKFKDLSSVLNMDNILLILDGLEERPYDKENLNSSMKYGIDSSFNFNTLVEKILTKQLLPKTDVLIVSHHDSMDGFHKEVLSFVLQDLTETETETICKTFSPDGKTSLDNYERLRTFTYIPAFVIMMCKMSKTNLEIKDSSSPYQLLTHILLQWSENLKRMNFEMAEKEKENFIKLAKESYENLVKGMENKKEAMKQWDYILNAGNMLSKYQSNILRDMFAAMHCVWETQTVDSFTDCLNFWVFFCHDIDKNKNTLLKVIAEEHGEKFYHFIRFFMRLLIYPNQDSFFNNTPIMDDDKRNLLLEWFKTNITRLTKNYEKLRIIHCIFELHDEEVTRGLSSFIKEFTLYHTPLNFIDIQALEYYFRDIKLEQLDLRLCTLRDRDVRQLRIIIKNTKHVLLSSNNLTAETATILGDELKDTGCVIERLELGTNQLGPLGAQTLWRALEHNRSLTSLTFYDNNIGDEGTIGMVEHLQSNNSLKELHLCGNTFGDEGYRNVQELKDIKKGLTIVMKITENLELFQWVEEKIKDTLNGTWENYNQDWLKKLLETAQADLQSKNCNKDPNITWEQVDTLIKQVEEIKCLIRRTTQNLDLEDIV